MQVIPELLDWVCWHGRFYQVRDRTRNKTTKAITLYLCNCQQQECYYPQERVPLEECKPTVAHIRKPGWSGYIHSIPWGLEGICADVIWLKSPIDPKTGELLPLPTMPQRYPVKDLIKPQEILEKPLCERHQDNGLRPSNYLSLNDGGFPWRCSNNSRVKGKVGRERLLIITGCITQLMTDKTDITLEKNAAIEIVCYLKILGSF